MVSLNGPAQWSRPIVLFYGHAQWFRPSRPMVPPNGPDQTELNRWKSMKENHPAGTWANDNKPHTPTCNPAPTSLALAAQDKRPLVSFPAARVHIIPRMNPLTAPHPPGTRTPFLVEEPCVHSCLSNWVG